MQLVLIIILFIHLMLMVQLLDVQSSFTTNTNGCYCVSAPTSVDGNGITNVQIVSTNFANTVSTSPVYNDHTATPVTMFKGLTIMFKFLLIQVLVMITNIVIWIDANDDFNLDASNCLQV